MSEATLEEHTEVELIASPAGYMGVMISLLFEKRGDGEPRFARLFVPPPGMAQEGYLDAALGYMENVLGFSNFFAREVFDAAHARSIDAMELKDGKHTPMTPEREADLEHVAYEARAMLSDVTSIRANSKRMDNLRDALSDLDAPPPKKKEQFVLTPALIKAMEEPEKHPVHAALKEAARFANEQNRDVHLYRKPDGDYYIGSVEVKGGDATDLGGKLEYMGTIGPFEGLMSSAAEQPPPTPMDPPHRPKQMG